MEIIAGIDIGNATTEVALAQIEDSGTLTFLASGIVSTTGIKGTKENIKGVHKYNEETMFDNYDKQGFDRYGYSAFDNKGTFVGVGNGVDRDGYTEEDYEQEEEY